MTTTRANTMPGRWRPLAIIGMLSAALVLIGVLGWQSWRLQQSNAATAESVLREYAILVADELGRRATAELGYRGYYQLVTKLAPHATPDAMRAALAGDDALSREARLVDAFFVVDGPTVASDAPELSAELDALLVRIARQRADRQAPYFTAFTASGREQVIFARRNAATGDAQIAGFVVSSAGIGAQLARVIEAGPLLPASLAGGQVSNDMLLLRISDPAGTVVFEQNPTIDARLSVSKMLGTDYQGILENFRIDVALDPESAALLVIGGLPGSRLPLLLVVTAFVVLLMLTAIWLFRREQAVMHLRADFVSQVSHELRTPLTQIRMFAETLLLGRARTEGDRRRSLEIINREARRLSHLVDNILRFSNGAGASRVEPRAQALAPVVREVCDIVGATAGAATLSVSVDESLQASVDADALRQVLLNLVDNAIKYGPPQQLIGISLARSDGGIRLLVEDQGPGIPEAERRRVWSPFYRLRREQDTAVSGTGIGLSVVQQLVEAMNGRCWIDASDSGTRVCVEFPEATADG